MGTVKKFPDWSVAFFVWTGNWRLLGVGGGEGQGWSEEGERRVPTEDRRMK